MAPVAHTKLFPCDLECAGMLSDYRPIISLEI